jgi:hypothetical protein
MHCVSTIFIGRLQVRLAFEPFFELAYDGWKAAMAKGRDKRRRVAKRKKETPRPKAMALPDDSPSADDPDALVYAPLKPKPHLSSGALALPEPEEMEEEGLTRLPTHFR